MKLLDRYQSRVFQFALDVTARLSALNMLTEQEAETAAKRMGLDYADQVLTPLCRAGLLEKIPNGYCLAESIRPFYLAPGQTEKDYLRYILTMPEASLFLPEPMREQLSGINGEQNEFSSIELYAPRGAPPPEGVGPAEMALLLQGIRQRRLIAYRFRTRNSDETVPGITLPWKLEYSAFDRRWWIILYDPGEKRTIKARLGNLLDIQLLGPAHIAEAEVRGALERLLEPEPVVLEVEQDRGALERCFLVFEGQMFLETRQVDDRRCRLSFQYYRFDTHEILRRLLYLGPMVTLLSPAKLKEGLLELLDQALEA